jgi:dihydrofolate reductase
MRKLVYLIASTIDGFIADPGGHDPSGPDGFLRPDQDYLEHVISEYPETLPGQLRPVLGIRAGNRHFDAVVMGRATYELGVRVGVTSPYPQLRQYVVSRTMAERPDPAVEVIRGDRWRRSRSSSAARAARARTSGCVVAGSWRERCARRSTSWW